MRAVAQRQHQHGRRARRSRSRRTTWRVPGCRKSSAARVLAGPRGAQDREDAAHRHVDVDVGRAVERVEHQQVLAARVLRRQRVGRAPFPPTTMPARWPPHSLARRKISLLSTSSGFCFSPCTLIVDGRGASCAMRRARRRRRARAMALQASDTSVISALRSPVAPGKRRRSSIRNWVSVDFPPVGMGAPCRLSMGLLRAAPARRAISRRSAMRRIRAAGQVRPAAEIRVRRGGAAPARLPGSRSFGPEVGRDHGPQAGGRGGAQAVGRVLEGDGAVGGSLESAQRELVDVGRGFLRRTWSPQAMTLNMSSPRGAERGVQQGVDVDGRGGARDGELAACLPAPRRSGAPRRRAAAPRRRRTTRRRSVSSRSGCRGTMRVQPRRRRRRAAAGCRRCSGRCAPCRRRPQQLAVLARAASASRGPGARRRG